MKVKNWSLATRLLHLGLVGTVTAQLFISLVMVAPDDNGSVIEKMAYEAHEVVGLTALAIVLVHWLWSVSTQVDGGLKHLFPWFGESREQLVRDARRLTRGQLPALDQRGGLVGFIHGLGLLAVTAIALTGGVLFAIFPETGEPGALVEGVAGIHEALATLVWIYWGGHGGMAILHSVLGHDVTKKMFTIRASKKDTVTETANHESKRRSDVVTKQG